MDIAIDRTIVSATYGVHDRVDLGVIVPVGRARVSGFSTKYQLYQGSIIDERENSSGSSFGIGDIVIRGKAALSGHATILHGARPRSAAADWRYRTS